MVLKLKRSWVTWLVTSLALTASVILLLVGGVVSFLLVSFPDPPTSPLVLPSGGQVDVIGACTLGSEPVLWELQYRTRLPLSDRTGLAAEVLAVWEAVQGQADRAGASDAAIRPVSFRRRVVFDGWNPAVVSHDSTVFSFARAASGKWRAAQGWPQTNEQ